MSTLLGMIVLLSTSAWFLVKRYERHLDAQLAPWLTPEFSRLRPVRVRVRSGNR